MNAYESIEQLVYEAKRIEQARNNHAKQMGYLLRGKLKLCSHGDLVAFKKELANYNIHTGRWKA